MRMIRVTTGAAVLGLLILAAPLMGQGDDPMMADINAGNNAALATQYQAEAKSLRAKAEMHKKMLEAYEKSPAYKRQHPSGGLANMTKHCQKLIDSYSAAADQAEALAKEHTAAEGGN